MPDTFDTRLATHYAGLSTRLKAAADYISVNPIDTASRSLRSVASESGLAPSTFSRLARALGYTDFEALRDGMRMALARRVNSFTTGVERLQDDAPASFATEHLNAWMANLTRLGAELNHQKLDDTVNLLVGARRVVLVGALGSHGIVNYSAYLADFIARNWEMAGRGGISMASSMSGLDERDVVLVITKPPFASSSIGAGTVAAQQGAKLIVLTESHVCPLLPLATHSFVLPAETPHYFSSYATTLFLMETIIGMLASRLGPDARKRIAEIEQRARRLDEVAGEMPDKGADSV